MATQALLQPIAPPPSSSSSSATTFSTTPSLLLVRRLHHRIPSSSPPLLSNFNATLSTSIYHRRPRRAIRRIHVGIEDAELPPVIGGDNYVVTATTAADDDEEDDEVDPTPDDLENISQIKRVLELLKKNRDMLFGEVKLTISIEDPRELERRRLLGIDDSEGPTREDLVAALEEVNEGKTPRNRLALQMLAEEMASWPNLEVEATKTKGKNKSLYAKVTDTGIDPKVAAKRLNVDWDSAAEIDETDSTDDNEVPSVLGYGALYLVTAFPVIIGIAVVLILFYNSLQ